MPLAVPPNEIGDSDRASDRALPWPLTPPDIGGAPVAVFATACVGGGAAERLERRAVLGQRIERQVEAAAAE